MNRIMEFFRSGISILLMMAMLFTVGGCSSVLESEPEITADPLPVVGSYDNLISILEKAQKENPGFFRRGVWAADVDFDVNTTAEGPMAKAADTGTAAPQVGGTDFSTTNVQVQGVDEADIVKTDGKYIYHVNNQRITVTQAYPAENMKQVNILSFKEEFYPMEMYLDSRYLVVIGGSIRHIPLPDDEKDPLASPAVDLNTKAQEDINKNKIAAGLMPPYQNQGTVRVLIYDAGQPEQLQLVRDFEVEGSYITSRKIGSQLHLVTNRYIYYYPAEVKPQEIVPWYRDDADQDEFQAVDYKNICYFPDTMDTSYMLIASLDLDKIQDKVDVSTYLGAGQTVYASQDSLYVAASRWIEEEPRREIEPSSDTADEEAVRPDEKIAILPFKPAEIHTLLYKFAFKEGHAIFTAKGEVPGTLLNQFSMDEHNGYFRIATTVGDMWRNDEFTSKNNLYILDGSMNTKGSIEDIAPGERIYSVRFMGDRAYMVTFRTVDPLFVIDLKDPENPSILGELKIPGYSSYLHPYDENHILGFGMDAMEVNLKDENGKVYGTTAYQMGMKVAMFDVSDVNHPVERFVTSIGDRGTYADILYNHKALLFNREKNILAFPVTVMEAKEKWMDREKTIPNYGEFAFQGVYVYNLDIDHGFTLRARISHLTPEETKNAQTNWYPYEKTVERALYIDDTLYTLSKAVLKAHSMKDYKEVGELNFDLEN